MGFDFSQSSYISLREAVLPDTQRLVIWCGAGLSAPAGIPTWAKLRGVLQDRLREKAAHMDEQARRSIERQFPSLVGNPNHWVAFERLKKELGRTTYRDTIREQLSPAVSVAIPESYIMLWHLRIAGMITLNLDAFALRGFNEANIGKKVENFTGTELANYMHVLNNPNVRFLCHLHGIDSNASSWVFTHGELKGLFQSSAYQDFLKIVLTAFRVIFIGISPDDVAVGSHLRHLLDLGFDFNSHFWITNRHDKETNSWAEDSNVRIIYYNSYDQDHSELNVLLKDLTDFVPKEDNLSAYPPAMHTSNLTPVVDIPAPVELGRKEPEEIRTILNQKALHILRSSNEHREVEFAAFVAEYSYAIHNAWYVSTKEGENVVLGYRLIERKNRGAFGQIYKAVAPDGTHVAIKLLKDEVRNNPLLLQSFRRGVKAMQILSEHRVAGMVEYKEAYEIPTFVAMDWIDGHDFRQAVEIDLIDTWKSLLEVAIQIATILKAAHSLPERVLHRDLRPANIMLQRSTKSNSWQVFLLDFDLSWYLGSIEQSVVHGSDSFGFLAPEQIAPREGASSRHPAVDSYGLGMTFYFAVAKKNPVQNQHLQPEWNEQVRQAASSWKKSQWKSSPNRFSRLVSNMTKDNQTHRWDLAQIHLELARLLEAEKRPSSVTYADMIAEEIAMRSDFLSEYEWLEDKQAAVLKFHQTGLSLELAGYDGDRSMRLIYTRVRAEQFDNLIGNKITESGQKIAQILRSAGWKVETAKSAADRTLIDAILEFGTEPVDIDQQAAAINLIGRAIPRY